jgi:hypothetical protein
MSESVPDLALEPCPYDHEVYVEKGWAGHRQACMCSCSYCKAERAIVG